MYKYIYSTALLFSTLLIGCGSDSGSSSVAQKSEQASPVQQTQPKNTATDATTPVKNNGLAQPQTSEATKQETKQEKQEETTPKKTEDELKTPPKVEKKDEKTVLTEKLVASAQKCSPANGYAQYTAYLDSVAREGRAVSFTSFEDEKTWLQTNMQRNYLWRDSLSNINATSPQYNNIQDSVSLLNSLQSMLSALKTKKKTDSGRRLDRFSMVLPTTISEDYFEESKQVGSGILFKIIKPSVPRLIRVAQVFPDSLAKKANVKRGDRLVKITISGDKETNSYNIDSDQKSILSTAMFVPSEDNTYIYHMVRIDGSSYDFTFKPTTYKESPVPVVRVLSSEKGTNDVGYLLFNNHNDNAEIELFNAFTRLKDAAVNHLVIDLRYNGGGYLSVSQSLASMIMSKSSEDKPYLKLTHNKYNSEKDKSLNFATKLCASISGICSRNDPLPHLGLNTVHVLVSDETCSASESLINGLRGVGVTVNVIGSQTCGKPVGFIGTDNCGLSYYITQFKVVNIKDESDYFAGFTPTCSAKDDFKYSLGDPNEEMLNRAMHLINHDTCENTARSRRPVAAFTQTDQNDNLLTKPRYKSISLVHE